MLIHVALAARRRCYLAINRSEIFEMLCLIRDIERSIDIGDATSTPCIITYHAHENGPRDARLFVAGRSIHWKCPPVKYARIIQREVMEDYES